jgi:hypothetical protein
MNIGDILAYISFMHAKTEIPDNYSRGLRTCASCLLTRYTYLHPQCSSDAVPLREDRCTGSGTDLLASTKVSEAEEGWGGHVNHQPELWNPSAGSNQLSING